MPINLIASAFLFDMDGTLVDSGAVVEGAWALWSAKHGLDLNEVLTYSHGRPTLATMNHFGQRLDPGKDWSNDAAGMLELEIMQSAKTMPIPGAAELLAQLTHAPWAVVTSAPRKLAQARIHGAGLPLPRVLIPADEISQGKPHPEGFLKASRELNVPPAECVVFEDTPPGIEAGLAAGMQVVGLLTTVSPDRLQTRDLIHDYLGLKISAAGNRFRIADVKS